jgi:hypothetical protein
MSGPLLVLFAIIVFLVVLSILIGNKSPNPFEQRIHFKTYSTKQGHRIFGMAGESVINGQFVGWMQSLWQFDNEFFILSIDELNYPIISVISEQEAKKFITDHAKEAHAKTLLRDFFGIKEPPS